ncbi:hypothetical protein CONLIGDRAFT_513435 [Coniochaeta ligniaria NRRL 30616]|uniref:Abscission/NoCut checkpoint regulator n=1 Tax=Coniochaeta ligniaria NRRL 30616 TaxID=1408157 RepID=A0A1J7IEY0_9PEZI|nr:hypothetical protein CONLIGDRAFT_513435 [Coniochaeta ligniaria NRRL 30616]
MADDRSLLDRLNALKPTSVSLDKEEPKLALSALSTAEPTSKEDALSARLRTLRNASASPRSPPHESGTLSPGPQAQPQLARDIPASPLSKSQLPLRPPGEPADDENADIDPLFHTDDSTLDEFLESLNLEDDVSLDQPPPLTFDPKDEAKKVAALLEELGKPATDPSRHDRDGKDDDDSDGEEMSAQVKKVLSRALDEAELDRSLSAQEPGHDDAQHAAADSKQEADIPGPSPPQDPTSKSDDTDPFSLPTVPSQLADPIPSSTSQGGPADFESSIAARMAALKGVSYGTSDTDAFGLPQAPSFNPDERAEPRPSFAGRLHGGYTDEDQKTWCVVCLEDATIKCIGCDDDVYCGRCWRDMHVGPRAGYDERGHQWVKFERRRW